MNTRALDDVAIASPCSADWNQMVGDDRRRLCAQCKLHVHDLSAMTSEEALAFLQNVGSGRACVRLFRRADGRVLTKDCPVGLRARLRRARARVAALWLALWAGPSACSGADACPVQDPDRGYVMGEMVAPAVPGQDEPTKTGPVREPVESKDR